MEKIDASTGIKEDKVEGLPMSLSQPAENSANSDSTNVCCTNVASMDNQQNALESVDELAITAESNTSNVQPPDISSSANFNQNTVKEGLLKNCCNEDKTPVVVRHEIHVQTTNLEEPPKEIDTVVSHKASEIVGQHIEHIPQSTQLECWAQVLNLGENVATDAQTPDGLSTAQHQVAPHVNTDENATSNSVQPVMAIDSPHIDTIVSNKPSAIVDQNIELSPQSTQLECRAKVPNFGENVTDSQKDAGSPIVQLQEAPNPSPHIVSTGENTISDSVQPVITIDLPHIDTVNSHKPSEIVDHNIELIPQSTELECRAQVLNLGQNVLTGSQKDAGSSIVQGQEALNTSSHVVNTSENTISNSLQPVMAIDSPHIQQCLNASGLSLLASQYDTDSDSDDVYEVPGTQIYQNRVVEIDSDSSTDVEVTSEDRGHIDLEILCAGHGEDDDEENIRNSRPPKVKGELQYEDLPPIQDLHITVPEEECVELGKIQSIVEQLVLVNSLPGTVPLDLETVLFLDKGKQVLGEIFDVLGQVSDPLYCVRFNSNKEIKDKGIEVGQTVYVAPRTQHTQFIVLANLMKLRGSDASWENDVEPPARCLDYSDDEEEREARRPPRNRTAPMDTEHEAPKRHRFGGGFVPTRPFRGNYHGPPRQPYYQPPSNYDIAGNSWHTNYYQNYVHPQQQHQHYRMPVYPQNISRPPPPITNPGMVLNPYAVFPPPQLMQQPLFPPQHAPPPPPPHGGF